MTSALAGKLLYDSARSSANVGVRAGLSVSRSLVFQSDGYSVDLVLHAGLWKWGYVYGQVIQLADGEPVRQAAVKLEETGELVNTDECGQFSVGTHLLQERQVLQVLIGERLITCAVPALEEAEAD